jgi:hypothetical protein
LLRERERGGEIERERGNGSEWARDKLNDITAEREREREREKRERYM